MSDQVEEASGPNAADQGSLVPADSRYENGARALYAIADDSMFETVRGCLRRRLTELDELFTGASR